MPSFFTAQRGAGCLVAAFLTVAGFGPLPAGAVPVAAPVGGLSATAGLPGAASLLGRARVGNVDWNSGWGPAEKRTGLPNPRGWYRAALGERPNSKVLYLTYDDGPGKYTSDLLDLLDEYDAHATFFVQGSRAAGNRGVLRRIVEQGSAVANHTWNHPQLTSLSKTALAAQLSRTTAAAGPAMGGCMRPPFGLINTAVAKESLRQGLTPILWTAHIEDWNSHPVSWHVQRLRAGTKPGAVILMHDTTHAAYAATKALLPEWQQQGWRLASIPACR